MNKSIVIIDAYLCSRSRISFFKEVLQSVKKLGIPIMVISNTFVPKDIQDDIDYCIYDKANILFDYEYDSYDMSYLTFENDYFKYENYTQAKQKHGLSVLCNLSKSVNFAKQLGFTEFIHVEWDLLIKENDIKNIKILIEDFICKNKKAFFLYNFRDERMLMEFPFHFWISNIDFWQENFPQVYNEDDYLQFIISKNKCKKFEIAERFLCLSFENKIKDIDLICEKSFLQAYIPNSKVNEITSYVVFEPPSGHGVFRGLSKVFHNSKLTGELIVFTHNSMYEDRDETEYEISFNNRFQIEKHITNTKCWNLSSIKDFDYSHFPITLQTNHGFKKTYKNEHEINSFFIKKI